MCSCGCGVGFSALTSSPHPPATLRPGGVAEKDPRVTGMGSSAPGPGLPVPVCRGGGGGGLAMSEPTVPRC